MRELLQQIIGAGITQAELVDWQRLGVEIDGTLVCNVPPFVGFSLEGFTKLQSMIKPEFDNIKTKIRASGFRLESYATDVNKLIAQVTLTPHTDVTVEGKEYGYAGRAYLIFGEKDHPEYVLDALRIGHRSPIESIEGKLIFDTDTGIMRAERYDFQCTPSTDYNLENAVKWMKGCRETTKAVSLYEKFKKAGL